MARLDELPNIGKAMAGHLQSVGIDHPWELIGKDPMELYEKLCSRTEKKVDPCAIDVFISAIDFMEGGDPHPWWSFTDKRKKFMAQDKKS